MADNRRVLLRDDPLESLAGDNDQFRHTAYEQVLREILDDVDPPFTVGLYGKWGTGKSTITKQLGLAYLHNKDEKRTCAYVTLDVWKFQSDSFRRQFLRTVEAQLVAQRALDREEVRKKLDKQVSGPADDRPLAIDVKAFALTGLAILGLYLVLAFSLYFLFRWGHVGVNHPEASFLLLVLVPLTLQVFARVPNVVVRPTATTLPPVTADSFEEMFNDDIVRRLQGAKISKVVTVIDNLDRLQSDQVVEVLASIKTYLEHHDSPFVFVVPCDAQALGKHIKRRYSTSQNDAEEFLRKFFNVTVTISPFYEYELSAFAKKELCKLELTREETATAVDRVAEMIGTAFPDGPRRVKQFINNVAARRLVARARIDDGILNLGVKFSLELLVKLMIIEERWPDVFQRLSETPGYIGDLQAEASGAGGDEDEIEEFRKHGGLRDFLLATEDLVYTSGAARAYVKLKQTDDEAQLPDYDDFRGYLTRGDADGVRACFSTDTPLSETRWRIMISILKEAARSKQSGQARNALSVICALSRELGDPTAPERVALANQIGPIILRYDILKDGLQRIPPCPLLDALSGAPAQIGRLDEVIGRYIALVGSMDIGDATEEIVRCLAERIGALQKHRVEELALILKNRFAEDTEILLAATPTKAAASALITPETIEQLVASLSLEMIQ